MYVSLSEFKMTILNYEKESNSLAKPVNIWFQRGKQSSLLLLETDFIIVGVHATKSKKQTLSTYFFSFLSKAGDWLPGLKYARWALCHWASSHPLIFLC